MKFTFPKDFKIIFLLLLLSVLFYSCYQQQQLGDYYFEFDQVDWFNIELETEKLVELEQSSYLIESQKRMLDLVFGHTPESLADTSFINYLTDLGFEKKVIHQPERIADLKEIFRQKSHDEISAFSCVAVFRDILIFRKSDKIVGMAKICFDCSQHQIVGSAADTHGFGQTGDFSKLRKLLTQ